MLFVVFKKCIFSLCHRSLSRKANRYLMGIHFLEEFVFLVALTCLPWKIHLFPGSVGVQDCWRSRCGFTADVCLLCLVQATLSELMRSAEVRPNTSLFINVQDCSAKKKKKSWSYKWMLPLLLMWQSGLQGLEKVQRSSLLFSLILCR